MRRWLVPLFVLLLTVAAVARADDCTDLQLPDDTPCDDGNACTVGEACKDHVCQGGTDVVCDSASACHVAGTCDPTTGCPAPTAVDDGTACDDGDACTQGEMCTGGTCGGGTPVTCVALDACHVAGTCDPSSGVCSNPVADDGTACDDGLFCTVGDACVAGVCTGPLVRDCAGAGDPCNDGVCDEPSAACVATPKPGLPACDDGNACTHGDHCAAGACVPGDPTVCSASDVCHVAGTCDPASGACSNPVAPDTKACDDGDACTQSDHCSAGTCVGTDPVVCTASDVCHVAGTCNPATGACSNPVAPDTKACDDGDACTQSDHCSAGTCVGTDPVVCTASDVCHVAGICNPTTGACSNPVAPDTNACDDGDACTQTDHCAAGICVGTNPVVCIASDACHLPGTCNPTSGSCTNPVAPDTTSCDDGAFCTVGDHCAAGACAPGAPRDCAAAGDQCNDGVCDEGAGRCVAQPKPGTPACDDGNPCTRSDRCDTGTCVGADPLPCPAPDDCHLDGTCDSATGACVNAPADDDTPCDDGAFCTVGDACHGGTCTPGAPRDCHASDDQCNDGTCDEQADRCVATPKPGTPACDDGNACTHTDRCVAGACVGNDPVTCTASDACHVAGTCDPGTGTCSNPNAAENTPCDDGAFCTVDDRCHDGACTAGPSRDCSAAGDVCNDGVCDEGANRCVPQPKSGSPACDDHDACTRSDHCAAGVCVGADPVVCTASDQCHAAGTCDPASGVCSNPNKPDFSPCTDGSVCTAFGTCQTGACRVVRTPGCCLNDGDCADTIGCTEDRCVANACVHTPSNALCDGGACGRAFCTPGAAGADAAGCTIVRMPGCCVSDDECADALACTDDRCVANACMHTPVDARCGDAGECARTLCTPGASGADTAGCLVVPRADVGFCTEDRDACTADQCRAGACVHDPTGAPADCAVASGALASALDLRARTESLRGVVDQAASTGCSVVGPKTGCDLVGGSDSAAERLLALLAEARGDLDSAIAALGGRVGVAGDTAQQGGALRARLALTLIQNTPNTLRSFRATLAVGRAKHQVSPTFARARRAEGLQLLHAASKLRSTLKRAMRPSRSFAS